MAAWLALRVLPAGVRAIAALRARARGQIETLARVEDVVMHAPAVRDSMAETFRDIVALAPELVDGEAAADAQASLSALLSLAANRHSLKVVRVDPLPDSTARPFHRVALHAELEGDVAGVTGMLAALETGEPLLSVSALSIETPDPSPRARMSEVLRLMIEVRGYYLVRSK
jgi:hypothetical protein